MTTRVKVPYGPGESQFGHLYIPTPPTPDADGVLPPVRVVVLVHGGYWSTEFGLMVQTPVAKDLADRVKAAEVQQADAEAAFTAAHLAISNVIIDGVPAGGEDDYAVLDVIGEPAVIDNPKDHLELGEKLGLIDMERGAKVSGSRFYFLTGQGALLQLGLLQMAIRLAADNGFTPIIPPVLVRPEVMSGTGFLGAHADEVYRIDELEWITADDSYAVCRYRFAWIGTVDGQPRSGSGRGTSVLVSNGGTWQMLHEHLST